MIEAIVVLGIFSVLLTAGANLLITTTRNSSRVAIQNEVRQEASKIMQDIITETRQASEYIIVNGDLITASASGTTTYHLDATTLLRNKAKFSSENVTVSNFNASSVNNSLVIVLTVQQKDESITLTDTVTPRSY